MSDSAKIKNKFRYFTFYKWGAIICFILSIIFLFVGISQSISGGSTTDVLKSDFSNLSKDKPVSTVLQEVENIGVEYTAKTSRRSTTTYNYFIIKVNDKKLILESEDKDEVKKGSSINIRNSVSPTTAENQNNIKTLAVKNNIDEGTKISEQELLDIKFVEHYTESDKLGSDYWGWFAFFVSMVGVVAFGIRYWWEKRNYTIAVEDIQQALHGNSQLVNTHYPQPKYNSQDFNTSNTNSLANNQNGYQDNHQSKSVSMPVHRSGFQQNQPKNNKAMYILLAVFLGIFGIHHFYSHRVVYGFMHLIWLFCLVVSLFAIEQLALMFLLSFILLPLTFVASLIQALMKVLSKG